MTTASNDVCIEVVQRRKEHKFEKNIFLPFFFPGGVSRYFGTKSEEPVLPAVLLLLLL